MVGFHPVRELLRSRPHDVAELLIAPQRAGSRRREIEALAQRHHVAMREVADRDLARLAKGATHNGFAAHLVATDTEAAAGTASQLVVLLEDIQDPRNLGAILRVCEASGAERVLVRDKGSAPIGPVAVKASAGASAWVHTERIVNSAQEIERLKKAGYWVYGADERGRTAWEVDLSGPVVLCLGGEDKGLRQRTRGLCDELIALPMQGRVASLNVATAAAALLFEIVRQRQVSSSGQ